MSNTPYNSDPLLGDAARQAPDLHRGIIFQIWRSVEAWINLAENELLYLEGAEDFDIVSKDSGVLVQIKATAANITLRSEAVLQAILNFWLVRCNHPEKRLRFRFITTAAIGAEAGNPFGDGRQGLKLWQECATNKDLILANKLKKFLTSDRSIAARLESNKSEIQSSSFSLLWKFLGSATAEEVFDQLIEPMSWEVESVDEDVVREAVSIGLRAYGEGQRCRPDESTGARDHLYVVTAETAKRKSGRTLCRDDCRREFQLATSRRMSWSEIAALEAGAAAMQLAMGGTNSVAIIPGYSLIQRGVPSLQESSIRRSELVDHLVEEFQRLRVIVVKGSSGMGKSTAAKLAATQIGGSWVWVDLQDVQSANIPSIIRGLAALFIEMPDLKNIGLDNLNFEPSDLTSVELSLPAILRSARNRGGLVILTTQRELPARIVSKMGLTEANLKSTPRFDVAEIVEFAKLLGCPMDGKLEVWAKLIYQQTSGHPRLVHARLSVLENSGWPTPKSDDLIGQPPELVEEREIARQLLDNAPSGDKELLYRLSVATGPFRKDHAISVGQAAPPLDYPADSFTRLVGPWIDSLGEGYFRLSPLLHNAAAENWSQEKVKFARISLAEAMLSHEEKTLIEASEILFQGIFSESEELVTGVVMNLHSAPPESTRHISDQLSWLVLLGRSNGARIFRKNPYLNFFLRLLQFRIIANQSPQKIDDYCLIVDTEFTDLEQDGKMLNTLRISWLLTAIMVFQAPIRPDLLVSYWGELITIFPTSEIFEELDKNLKRGLEKIPQEGSNEFHSQLMLMILARQMNTEQLVLFAQAINNLAQDVKELAINDFKYILFTLRLTVDRSWTCELERNDHDWDSVLGNFVSFKQEVKSWGIPDLLVFIARAMAAIEDEYRHNPTKAEEILKRVKNLTGTQNYLAEDQHAIILYRSGKFRDALDIWQTIIPVWPIVAGSADQLALYACERAGNAASQIFDWPLTISFLQRGHYLAGQFDQPLFQASYQADEAFAVWKSGDRISSLGKFAEILSILETLESSQNSGIKLHRIRKMFEQLVKWCRFDAGIPDDSPTWEPPVGLCSRLDSREEILNFPPAPFDFQWYYLAEIEIKVLGPGRIFDLAAARVENSKHVAFRSVMGNLNLDVLFSNQNFASLINILASASQAFAESKLRIERGDGVFQADNFGPTADGYSMDMIEREILSALIALAGEGKSLDLFGIDWKTSADNLSGDAAKVVSFLGRLQHVLKFSQSQLKEFVADENHLVSLRRIATLRRSLDPQLPLESLFIAQASLLDYVYNGALRRSVDDSFGRLIQNQWRQRISLPATLLTPRITVPAIRRACDEGGGGLKQAAKILLEARFALRIKVPNDILAFWRKVAAD